jgi:ADP-ribose pyrophosphatase YjhB (NUDIX family)
MPITSIGIIVFRYKPSVVLGGEPIIEYLLIRRKDTLGYIDFMRGKYSVYNKDYIMNMLKQMTNYEKERLCIGDFNLLWKDIWGNSKCSNQYKSEEFISREKYNTLIRGIKDNNIVNPLKEGSEYQSGSSTNFSMRNSGFLTTRGETPHGYLTGEVWRTSYVNDIPNNSGLRALLLEPTAPPLTTLSSPVQEISSTELIHVELERGKKILENTEEISDDSKTYSLKSLIEESNQYQSWEEPEWGFPKGRRNNQESDYECAIREFKEETGYNHHSLTYIQNVLPLEEIFMGSNYKAYKHKYFLMYMDYNQSLDIGNFQTSEVSKVEWKSFEECISCFRPYNLEKKRIIMSIDEGLKKVFIQ